MGSLGRRALRNSAVALAVVLALACSGGLVRLLPWLLAPEVPFEVTLPFARALGASATETAFLFGVPLGFGLAAASFVERGEARALAALGASPYLIAGSIAPHAAAAALVSLFAGAAWGSAADVPGRFAGQLVNQGRQSCAHARAPRSASVPLVGVSWLCFPGNAPRVAGSLPGAGPGAWFTATNLTPSDDLRSVELQDLRIVARYGEANRRVEISVRQGTIHGLPAWGRSKKLSPLARGMLVLVSVLGASVCVVGAMLALGIARRWQALLFAGAPALAAFALLHRLDSSALAASAYALVPLSALVVIALMALVTRRVAGPLPR